MVLPMLVYGAVVAHRFYYGFDIIPFVGPHIPGLKDVRARDAYSDAARLAAISDRQFESEQTTWRAFKTPGNYVSMSVETAVDDLSQSPRAPSLTSRVKTGGKNPYHQLEKGGYYVSKTRSWKKGHNPCSKGYKIQRINNAWWCVKQ